MQHDTAKSFTFDHTVFTDGTVTFRCASDPAIWPWLALHPSDPIVVQSINYYASVETGAARGSFDTQKWSALTETEWTCGPTISGHATHGIAQAPIEEGTPRYRLTFFSADNAVLYHMTGTGIVFRTRDFKAWRKEKKTQSLPDPHADEPVVFADSARLGVATPVERFLSNLKQGETVSARGLMTKETCIQPHHPYHGGSGDHVNSNHLADVSKQFLSLLREGQPFTVTGGDMKFTHYVELGRPFDVALTADGLTNTAVSLTVTQSGRTCSTISLRYVRST